MKMEMTWLVLAVSYLCFYFMDSAWYFSYFSSQQGFFFFFLPFPSLYSYQKDESC